MKNARIATFVFGILVGLSHVHAPAASAQCAQCTGPLSNPCRWGPFIDGGSAGCAALVFYEGCAIAGDCNPNQSNLLSSLQLTADGFIRKSQPGLSFSTITLPEGTTLFRTCTGLLQSIALDEDQQRHLESVTSSITI